MIKQAILFVTVAAVAFIVYSYFFAPHVLTGIVAVLQPVGAQLQKLYNGIPDPIKGILGVISIPSIISGVFFAYTKIQAMKKLNETTQIANQKITQVEGEKRQLEAQLQGVAETGKSYSASTVDGIKGLATELKDTKDLLSEKQQEILDWKTQEEVWIKTRGRLEGDIKYYKKELETLQEKYDLATGVKKAPIG